MYVASLESNHFKINFNKTLVEKKLYWVAPFTQSSNDVWFVRSSVSASKLPKDLMDRVMNIMNYQIIKFHVFPD